MITSEIKINGAMIAHVYAVNITDNLPSETLKAIHKKLAGGDVYEYEVHSIASKVPTRKGMLPFKRENGALRLIQAILKDAVGEGEKKAPAKKKKVVKKKGKRKR